MLKRQLESIIVQSSPLWYLPFKGGEIIQEQIYAFNSVEGEGTSESLLKQFLGNQYNLKGLYNPLILRVST